MMGKRVFIAGTCRTPVGKFGQRLKDVPAQELLRKCFAETVKRTGIKFSDVEEAIAGTCIHLPDALNVARVAVLLASCTDEQLKSFRKEGVFPKEVFRDSPTRNTPAFTVARNCGSGLQAIFSATQEILSDNYQVILAGGTESMSNSPGMIKRGSFVFRQVDVTITDSLLHGLTDPLTGELMGLTAENVAEKHGITREEQDKYAAESHQRAFRAIREGKFKSQIVPVDVRDVNLLGHVRESQVSEDEGPEPSLTASKLGILKPYFKAGGTVTPANSCMVNDGAASCLVLSLEKAKELGVTPEAEIIAYAGCALDPSYMGEGPVYAIPAVLKAAGLTIDDIDVFEINESFASTTIAVQRQLNIPSEKLNIHGGALSLGHPVGASGAILTVKAVGLLKELKKTYAIVSLCVGNGQGVALLIKNYDNG